MANILYNVKCKITRENIVDDMYGGAFVTGTTIIAQNEPCRLDYYVPKLNITPTQGIETYKVYSLFFRSTRQHPIPVRENDIVQITFPPTHTDLNTRFRVRGVQEESLHPQDPNKIIECTLERIEESRGSTF